MVLFRRSAVLSNAVLLRLPQTRPLNEYVLYWILAWQNSLHLHISICVGNSFNHYKWFGSMGETGDMRELGKELAN